MGYVYRRKLRSGERFAIAYEDVNGQLKRELTKTDDKETAKRMVADRQTEVERAKLLRLKSVSDLISPKHTTTLGKFSNVYLDYIDSILAPRTADRYRDILKNHLLPAFGRLPLQGINSGLIQSYSTKRLKEKARPSTVRQELYVLSGLFREALKHELIDRNPVELVTKPTINNQIVRFLDNNEELHLLNLAPDHLRQVITVAIHSGLRDEELRNLLWKDVKFPDSGMEGYIEVRNTKGNKDRVVSMNETLCETLGSIPQYDKSPYVFTNPKTMTQYTTGFNNSGWKALLKRACIENFRFHDLRHAFASRLAQAGVSLISIKELMGHQSIQTTVRYAHHAPSDLSKAVKKLDHQVRVPDKTTTHRTTHMDNSKVERHTISGKILSIKKLSGPYRIRTCNQRIMSSNPSSTTKTDKKGQNPTKDIPDSP